MAKCHRHGDTRACGATTVVQGQDFVKIEGQLWAVDGDPNSHGAGELASTRSWLTINGKGIIAVADNASADNLCPTVGGPHCAPAAVGFSDLVEVS
jgi:hypothetical protein